MVSGKARVAERRGEQPDDEREAERDRVEVEGVARARRSPRWW